MASAVGIIAEYNPFHSGHSYHLKQSKKICGDETPVVCVMSGDFVQRGEPAIYSKFARSCAAVRNGCNLVIELPFPWCALPAQFFATAAIGILDRMGVSDISFGAENNLDELTSLLNIICSSDIDTEVNDYIRKHKNISYPEALSDIIERYCPDNKPTMKKPNNILALEYIKAINKLNSSIKPHAVQRIGSDHDSYSEGVIKSGMEIRSLIENNNDISVFLPKESRIIYKAENEQGRGPVNMNSLEPALLSRLLTVNREYYDNSPLLNKDVGYGIIKALKSCGSIEAICEKVSCKTYTSSNIRRTCLLSCVLPSGCRINDIPPYARILAADSKGIDYLAKIKKSAVIEIVSKPADIVSVEGKRIFKLGSEAHDLFLLSYTGINRCFGEDYRKSPCLLTEM